MTVDQFLSELQARAAQAGVFGEVRVNNGALQCAAATSAEPAWYRIHQHEGAWQVSLVTANRWLSESIEADLMHYGDPIEELIEEELVEQGLEGQPLAVHHYRSEDMLYTFRSPLPIMKLEPKAVEVASKCLLAYEAAFRELGDMSAGSEDDG